MAEERSVEQIADELVGIVRERIAADQVDLASEFVRRYYRGMSPEALGEIEMPNLYGAALAHLNLARERPPGVRRCHVYNPTVEQHGWQSGHTVIEVVCDDMPFLVDSVRMAIARRSLTNHLLIHPVMRMRRDESGQLEGIGGDGATINEAVMHFEVDRQTEQGALDGIRDEVLAVLADVDAAVTDWQAMRDRLREVLGALDASPPPIDADDLAEEREFLQWVDDDHFTFLGYREYRLEGEGDALSLVVVPDTGLGLLRGNGLARPSSSFASLPARVRALADSPELLILTKAGVRSTVHRPTHMDYIGVKRFGEDGHVVGEHRFLGLFTATAYNRRPRAIPLLRRKQAQLLERAGYPRNSHAGKALIQILETFPRDLLFQIDSADLYRIAIGILQLHERERIRVFVKRDRFGRFYSCIVFVPRDRFNTEVRESIQEILERSLGGSDTEFTVQLSESTLARLYFVLRVAPDAAPDYDIGEIEREIAALTHTWADDLSAALLDHCGEERGTRLYRRYGEAFRAGYRDTYPAAVAMHDIDHMEELDHGADIVMSLYRPLEAAANEMRFKLFRLGRPVGLSAALPMLSHMGLRVEEETPFKIKRAEGGRVWLHDFGMVHDLGPDFDLDHLRAKFQSCFAMVWSGEVEDDGFNRLVLRAGLDWREIVVLRAYCKYQRQLGSTFSQAYMQDTLAANPGIAADLVALFHAMFDPEHRDGERAEELIASIRAALDGVANLDQDRILRGYLALIRATLRTNFYQTGDDGRPKGHLSFKLDPHRVPDMPEPRPMFEIFVYSPRVEGVHLRGGPVARGGLRWSDRREDFRTEVLGLMKAQMVKNAVIVPVGSKGGFVPKRLPVGDRDAVLAEGIACYQIFVRGLLDLTDNLVRGEVVPPGATVRLDGDDPYLVVAADKGTATFSDIANEIATEYGYWLDDAFASGGSQGYDHKDMGITARGAWESVKRHFRELGHDTQSADFTVVGIGDMSGDVFGNGMLCSKHIRLVAAFNHLHVFIDPDPDPAASFAERERLFRLPRSSWDDYDRSLISAGGGIYPRSAKSIQLSPEAREVLGIDEPRLTPNELIRGLLRAPVDLLWNGGIGTYVKATTERNAEVGDRGNDGVRIDAPDLRCRVVGEGGNLGFTQLGRIEFARTGGRIHTDAIDNSGGVDCSDHEVNIKILLNAVVDDGDMTGKQRNELLASMTDEIASLVLRNNYLQTQALSVASAQAPSMLEVHDRLIRRLERDGHLARAIEFLPSGEAISERLAGGEGLSSPELSVLMAYCKIRLFHDLLDSDLPDEDHLVAELEAYFPTPLRARFTRRMPGHRLAREIVSTVVANAVVNHAGTTFAFRIGEETGAGVADVVRAFLIAVEVYQMRAVWAAIESLDASAPAHSQIEMLLEARRLVERAVRWLLRNIPRPLAIAPTVASFAHGVEALTDKLRGCVGAAVGSAIDERAAAFTAVGVPESLAERVASFAELVTALDLVEVANASGHDVESVARVYFRIGEELELHWLHQQINALPRANRWQSLSRVALREELYAQSRDLTASALGTASGDAEAALPGWLERNEEHLDRCRQMLAELSAAGQPDFAMLSVAIREIRALHRLADGGGEAAAAPVAAAPRKPAKETKSTKNSKGAKGSKETKGSKKAKDSKKKRSA